MDIKEIAAQLHALLPLEWTPLEIVGMIDLLVHFELTLPSGQQLNALSGTTIDVVGREDASAIVAKIVGGNPEVVKAQYSGKSMIFTSEELHNVHERLRELLTSRGAEVSRW